MNFNEFIERVQKGVSEFFGDGARVIVKEVIKNNGVVLHGLIITKETEMISPTIYLNSFYEEFNRGKPLGEIVYEIAGIYEQNRITDKINLDFFTDYNAVRGRVFQKVINFEKNRKMLENVPHVRFLDLAVVCYYAYMNDLFGKGSIQIETDHLDKWGISQEELFADARQNTVKKLGMELKGMNEVLFEMLKENLDNADMEGLKGALDRAGKEIPMYIMTLRGRYFGAVCICYEEMMRFFAGKCGRSFYILPSSIHEIILVPDSGRERPEELRKMVREVNAGHVALEEQLSDNIYYFNMSDEKVIAI